MQLRPLVDNPEIFIGYDETNQWLYVDWKGRHDATSAWVTCGLMLEALQAFPCDKILNDNSNIIYSTMQLTARSLEWLARMHAAGLRYLAWVLPRQLSSRQTTEGVVLEIEAPTVCTFDDLASAFVWLQRQDAPGPAA